MNRKLNAIHQALDVPDIKHQAASLHREAMQIAESITGEHECDPYKIAYHSFCSGWDAAIEKAGRDELLQENYTLHDRLIGLMARFGVECCPVCHGDCCDTELKECQRCAGDGWVAKQ